MNYQSPFGRIKEPWECDKEEFVNRAPKSQQKSIQRLLIPLSDDEFQKITAVCDPAEASLIGIGKKEFVVRENGRDTVYAF